MANIGNLITSGIMLGAGGSVVYALKGIPTKIYTWLRQKLMYTVTIYQNDELFNLLEEYLFTNYNDHYKDVEAVLQQVETSQTSNSRPTQRELRFKQEESFFIAKVGKKKIYISKLKEKLDKAQNIKEVYYRKYILRGLTAKKQINELLNTITDSYNQKIKKGTLKVYVNGSWGEWEALHDIDVKPFSKIIIDSKHKNNLISDINEFTNNKDWYKQRSIRHKRGYLLYGPPGNGKTSVAMAIAEFLNRDVYVLNLNSLSGDGSLLKAFGSLGRNIILLIEDIDKCFVKRENIDCKVSFSAVLNQFDGALCRDGAVTIITTNHIDKLDEALIRDGRMDFKLEIPNPSSQLVKEYLELFYDIKIAVDIEESDHSMSSVQEFCIRNKNNSLTAINHFLKQKEMKCAARNV